MAVVEIMIPTDNVQIKPCSSMDECKKGVRNSCLHIIHGRYNMVHCEKRRVNLPKLWSTHTHTVHTHSHAHTHKWTNVRSCHFWSGWGPHTLHQGNSGPALDKLLKLGYVFQLWCGQSHCALVEYSTTSGLVHPA